MALKRGLGKGLDSLIPTNVMMESEVKHATVSTASSAEEEKDGTLMVKLSKVEPNREQPRKNFDEDTLQELAESLKQFGMLQPILVQNRGDYYEIIAGERRWRAAKLAKLKEVPVIIKEYSDREVMEIALIENIQRKDLNPIEEALAYKSLIDEYSLKQEELANRVSKSRTAIANSMRLLKLTDSVQNMLINDEISMGHARALLTLEQEDLQIEAAKTIVSKGLSVRDTEKLVKSILNPKQVKLPIPSAEAAIYDAIANKLREKMGTKVSINHKKNGKGKIEIEYYSQEELERLIEMFDDIEE